MRTMTIEETAALREHMTAEVFRKGYVPTPNELRDAADGVEDFATARYTNPEMNDVPPFGIGFYSTAQALRNLADKLEKDTTEINERLAIAGELAAKWQGTAERAAALAQGALDETTRLSRELWQQRQYNRTLVRTIGHLLEDLEEAEGLNDEISFSFFFRDASLGHRDGLSPAEASDLALAMGGCECESADDEPSDRNDFWHD